MITSELYDIQVPRYTSYPTFPYWDSTTMNVDVWKRRIKSRFQEENGEVCLYIHLPFCEDLCTFCACNKRITKNHAVEKPYLESVLDEWNMYSQLFHGDLIVREIHLGGGTPTFFSPHHLNELIVGLTRNATVPDDHEFSVEVHPNHTTREHLEVLSKVGFNRISMGVQDFDAEIQAIINRHQTFESTRDVVEWSRELGYRSVNIDLVYGLPLQTTGHIHQSVEKIKSLMPDRIAYYSYAHVPWKSKGQRRYTDDDVPRGKAKYEMYVLAHQLLRALGYDTIGMDHFALKNDSLLNAYNNGTLHRNFMGYTTTNHKLVIGLGASSIGDTWDAFAQNEKEVEAYQRLVMEGTLPIVKGHALTKTDTAIRRHILDLMCTGSTTIHPEVLDETILETIRERLSAPQLHGLVEVENNRITATEQGRLFIRNVCSALDQYLGDASPASKMFSTSV
jgi:oxygen-independent coproporphyrinogen III oxidase